MGWSIRGLDDWASLPALLLLLSIFSFLFDPISNAYSRHMEHQADVYGLEVTHGILPDAAQAAADSFQVEGESSLAEPDPNPLNVFLFIRSPADFRPGEVPAELRSVVKRQEAGIREVDANAGACRQLNCKT